MELASRLVAGMEHPNAMYVGHRFLEQQHLSAAEGNSSSIDSIDMASLVCDSYVHRLGTAVSFS